MKENKILIGLVTGEFLRHATVFPSFIGLHRPVNSVTSTIHGQSPASGRNTLVKQAMENNCTHIFFMDDDMIFPLDTLAKLIEHDKDIVSALYLLRSYPHRPAFFDKAYPDGKCKYVELKNQKNLVKGVNIGFGAVLIRTSVFEKLEKPYVRLGEIEKDGWCDDVGFFNRCREAGFEIWCDLDAPVGHLTTVTIWPENFEDQWYTNYRHGNGNIRIPQSVQTIEELEKEELAYK